MRQQWGTLRRVRTVRSAVFTRRSGGLVRIHRRSTVQIRGEITVEKRLDLGCQWPGNAFPARSHLFVSPSGRLTVGGAFAVFAGTRIVIGDGATLTLGSGYINSDARIECFSSITIGEDVAIAEQVIIRDSDSHQLKSAAGDSTPTAPIVIGDHVWIGLGATVLKGVTIGEGAVVAARAIVTRDVPPRSLVAGVPARVVREDIVWE